MHLIDAFLGHLEQAPRHRLVARFVARLAVRIGHVGRHILRHNVEDDPYQQNCDKDDDTCRLFPVVNLFFFLLGNAAI